MLLHARVLSQNARLIFDTCQTTRISYQKVKNVNRKIFVIYPEEEEKKPVEMMFARKWSRAEVDLTQAENDLKNLIGIFENLEEAGPKYKVDEAKMTVGVIKGADGKLHASIAASFFSLIKGAVGGEISEKISENKLFEITIKRSSD